MPVKNLKSGLTAAHLFYELKHDRSIDSKTSRTCNLAINSRLACESVLVVVVDDKETRRDRDKLTRAPASS